MFFLDDHFSKVNQATHLPCEKVVMVQVTYPAPKHHHV